MSKTLKASVVEALSIEPTSVNPVLTSDITLTLSSSFPYILNRDDFTFEAYDEDDETYRRQIKVNSVDDSTKTLTGKFQGAYSGTYKIALRHVSYGLVDTSSLTLDVNAYVTSVSPTTISMYGGTLMTITGSNFGTEKTDNPV